MLNRRPKVRDRISLRYKDPVSETRRAIAPECMHIGNIFRDTSSLYGVGTRGISVHSFRTLLAELHRVTNAKDDNQSISACSFDPNLADTWRGNANIVSMSGLWLDNDGGDLAPTDFANMLKVAMIIYNSFSSTTNLMKWRVWIPTSHPITPAVHNELVSQIKKMLIDRKFYGATYIKKNPSKGVKHHGFDEGKLAQAVLFYLPCQAKAGAAASFFNEHHWQNATLDPYAWVDRTIVDHRPPTIPQAAQPPSEAPQTVNELKIVAANANGISPAWSVPPRWRNPHSDRRHLSSVGIICLHCGENHRPDRLLEVAAAIDRPNPSDQTAP